MSGSRVNVELNMELDNYSNFYARIMGMQITTENLPDNFWVEFFLLLVSSAVQILSNSLPTVEGCN